MMLIWMANIPEETIWYRHRWEPAGWRAVSWLLLIGHFMLPFIFLLPRGTKRNRLTLGLTAVWLLMMHYIDLFWLIVPSRHHAGDANPAGVPLDLTYIFLLIAMGCLYAFFFIRRLQARPAVPVRDPHLADSLAFENI